MSRAAFDWHEKDAVKNSITMAASAHFSHKQLQGINGLTKKEMLRSVGVEYDDMPAFFRRGDTRPTRVDDSASDYRRDGLHPGAAPSVRTDGATTVELPEVHQRRDMSKGDLVKLFFPSVFAQKKRKKKHFGVYIIDPL